MPLTDIKVKNARPSEKPVKLTDGQGLYLLVHPSGSKYWQLAYRFGGKQKVFSIGVYPLISLSEARKKRDEARKLIAEGTDPVQQKKLARTQSTGTLSFESVAREWHKKHSVSERWSASHSERVLNSLINHVFPSTGHHDITRLSTRDLLVPIRAAEAAGHAETAARLKQRITAIMRYAVQEAIITHNAALDLEGAISAPVRTHRPALELDAITDLLNRIEGYQGRRLTILAIRLTLLVFIRSSELRFARWPEIDFKNALWVIPPEREEISDVRFSARGSKMRTPHYVPLSRQAVEILEELKTISYDATDGQGLIFVGCHSIHKPMSENTVNKALRTMGYDTKSDICGHGFRTMACSSLVESGKWSEDAIERQMSHQERNQVRAAYIHKAKHLEQRRLMLQWWADFLDANKNGVVRPFEFSYSATAIPLNE
ncbi:DUF4102 domain-containing protein [Salmonella enterica]|nr:DUF4102 domain-containing protein [Salmonella enterica]HCX7088921.1 integrase arm-type DNA-binding domain-containing protein [Salmonella enterica subsp. enterica]